MVKRCIVGGCSNTKREGVSLHSFPTNPVSRNQWIKQIRTTRRDWTEPTSDRRDSQVVCSDHFKEDDFDPAFKLKHSFGIRSSRRLLPNAVPCMFSRHTTQGACTPDHQKSRVTAGLTTCSLTGAFQKRERARVNTC
ncbi:hypothetical protein ACJMK2_028654 [Sinanodonta woodiana]|uniref:THAP-type domain-containing protein n=1 Tax=Sinanodonta woodiana TaxID=1069815 RepID=A0ABD3V111_SINWO